MVNAWSLVYEELNGTMDETYPIMEKNMSGIDTTGKSPFYYEYDRNDPTRSNPFAGGGDEGTLNINTPIFGSAGPDSITFKGDIAPTGFGNSMPVVLGGGLPGGGYDWGDDGHSVVGNPFGNPFSSPVGNDHISINMDYVDPTYAYHYPPYPQAPFTKVPEPSLNKPGVHKYEEDKGITDLKDYVASTYSGHYTTKGSNVQTLDLIESVGDAESFCRSNAIKYLSRYDKKGQAKRDILKAMHYCLLLYYFSGNTNDEITTRGYETF